MTLPIEEKWALIKTKAFLESLIFIKNPIKSKQLQKDAFNCLRHFPMKYRINKIYKDET